MPSLLQSVTINLADYISISDLVGSFIGGLLGFIGAFVVLRIEENSRKREAKLSDRLTYNHVIDLLTSAIEDWNGWAVEHKTLVKDHVQEIWNEHELYYPGGLDTALGQMDQGVLRHAIVSALGTQDGVEAYLVLNQLSRRFEDRARRSEALVKDLREKGWPLTLEVERQAQHLIFEASLFADSVPVGSSVSVDDLKVIISTTLAALNAKIKPPLKIYYEDFSKPINDLKPVNDKFRPRLTTLGRQSATLSTTIKNRQEMYAKTSARIGKHVVAAAKDLERSRKLLTELEAKQ